MADVETQQRLSERKRREEIIEARWTEALSLHGIHGFSREHPFDVMREDMNAALANIFTPHSPMHPDFRPN